MTDTGATQPGEAADDGDTRLRRGWTTGACATAAAKAAFLGLQGNGFPSAVTIQLPGGQTPSFQIIDTALKDGLAEAAVIKDAGDDPDVTHGAVIRAAVTRLDAGCGVSFAAGAGVGTITKPGLPLAVGEPAINPAPRLMMTDNIETTAAEISGAADVCITISVDDGEALAEKTWNPRLGIVGGLSILGTSGIVIPYSCSAWIASIHQAIDVARAAGLKHLAGATGSTSEAAVARDLKMSPNQLVDMGDFVGGMLKYLRNKPVPRLTIAGGFGKLSKLAAGHMDLHSKRSQVDPPFLADIAAGAGLSQYKVGRIAAAESAGEILVIADADTRNLVDAVAARAREVAAETVGKTTEVDVRIYDRAGTEIGAASG